MPNRNPTKPPKGDSPAPAGYSPTDSIELTAISILRSSLNHAKVVPDIKELDKHPNSDGYLVLLDERRIPIGKLEVQVRSIPAGARSYQCPTSLFAYTLRTPLPVLLICVDVPSRLIYWKHVRHEDIAGKEHQASISVSFRDPTDTVSSTSPYLLRWEQIAKDYCRRVQQYEDLQRIAGAATPFVGRKSESIRKLQSFLDELNGHLDGSFSCVKRACFPGIWKVGLALQEWKNEFISYALFAIEEGKNEPLLKEMPKGANIFRDPRLGFTAYLGRNHISENPKQAARGFILDRLKEMLKFNGFLLTSEYLCTEYLFDYIDAHLYCLGLPRAETYTPDALAEAFYEYLPRWSHIAKTRIRRWPPHIPYFDPGLARMMVGDSINDVVKRAVKRRSPFPTFVMGSSSVSYGQLFHLVDHAREQFPRLNRLYRRSDERNAGEWIWSGHRQEEAVYNAELLYSNFPRVYRDFVLSNGLDFAELSPFQRTSEIVYFYLHPEPESNASPGTYSYWVAGDTGLGEIPAVTVLGGRGPDLERDDDDRWLLSHEGSKKVLSACSRGESSFLFRHTPMLHLIYRTLGEQFERVLGPKGSPGSAAPRVRQS